MNWLTLEQQIQIRKLAWTSKDREVCGFVLRDGAVIETPNTAVNPVDNFRIDPQLIADFHDDIKGIWHTHLELDGFSPQDQQQILAGDWPWAVYVLPTGRFWQVTLDSVAPFVGRPYCWGIYDCATVVEDWYASRGIPWPLYERGAYGEWVDDNFDAFDRLWPKVGVEVPLDQARADDMVQMSVGGHHVDHIGVLTGPTRMLHHPAERTSRISIYGDHWRRQTVRVVRPRARCGQSSSSAPQDAGSSVRSS